MRILTNTFGSEISITPEPLPGFDEGFFVITNTMATCIFIVAALIIFALLLRFVFIPRWEKNPAKMTGFEILVCSVFGFSTNNAVGTTDEHIGKQIAPFYFTFTVFMFLGVMVELIGFRPVLTDLNCAIALALFTFFFINFYGFKHRKARRLLRWLNPIVFVTDSIVPVSMSLRMFGSVLSGYIIMHILYGIKGEIPFAGWGALADLVLPAIASLIFTVFHAVMQTYVYMMLSYSFIKEAAE